ncbi:MAG TPA: hypothetical protein VNC50_07300 [Planctomycetia bacterium]|nr:hypothetical protein [Planctomycetia bacterium]
MNSMLVGAAMGLALFAGQDAKTDSEKGKAKEAAPPAAKVPDPRAAEAKPAEPLPPKAPAATEIFKAAEVKSWTGLAKRLQTGGDAELVPFAGIWKSFPEAARTSARLLAAGVGKPADEVALAAELQKALVRRDFAELTGFVKEGVRDPEAGALLANRANLKDAELARLNRLLFDLAFPFETRRLAADPKFLADAVRAYPPAVETSNYPPAAEISLELAVPRLVGRTFVTFEGGDEVEFFRNEKQTLKVKNTGEVRYRLRGDLDVPAYPRVLKWNSADVGAAGKLERPLNLVGGN